jgi:hypothetical protein
VQNTIVVVQLYPYIVTDDIDHVPFADCFYAFPPPSKMCQPTGFRLEQAQQELGTQRKWPAYWTGWVFSRASSDPARTGAQYILVQGGGTASALGLVGLMQVPS